VDDDDVMYYGQINESKLKNTYEQYASALSPVSDEDVFPKVPPNTQLRLAPHPPAHNIYIKRPQIKNYDIYKDLEFLEVMPAMMLDEIHALEIIAQSPHPNIIGYHGCRVRRGYITGLVLDRYESDLDQHLRENGNIDKGPLMDALEDAIRHLHSLGLAHNDINPANIMVNADGMPVLADFGSSREIGRRMGPSRGADGWIDETDDYVTSEKRHDIIGLGKIRAWLDDPVPLHLQKA
jgi:serine/threonine protein kinase